MWGDVWPAMDGVSTLILSLEGQITVSNNFTKRRQISQNGFKIGAGNKFAKHLR